MVEGIIACACVCVCVCVCVCGVCVCVCVRVCVYVLVGKARGVKCTKESYIVLVTSMASVSKEKYTHTPCKDTYSAKSLCFHLIWHMLPHQHTYTHNIHTIYTHKLLKFSFPQKGT